MLRVFRRIDEFFQSIDDELSTEANNRMAYKCLAAIWALGAGSMAIEAGVDWAVKGTPINAQTIGATILALTMAGGATIIGERGTE